ncbi:MAG: GTP 3',8-cyclase MoaA [Chloroflexi bacterium]|nr:GTP 3',8-cyclase MoaA [Chloroflexota bacterium]
MTALSDSFQRPINYLRISVTDRCNLRCIYCMPEEGLPLASHQEILSFEEIRAVVRAAAPLGINRLRLTGGEPLVRAGFLDLVRMLAEVKGVEDLSLTTNGILLLQYAARLKAAGLHRVNVSLDSLRSDRFHRMTRLGELENVLAGIEEAKRVGLNPVKINNVVVRGVNDDELLDFARKTIEDGWHVRFIELMPFGEGLEGACEHGEGEEKFISVREIVQRLAMLGDLEATRTSNGSGPAKYFRYPGAVGTVGFISPVSEHFCFGCNRLRLTADGRLRPCLLDDREIDLREALRRGASAGELRRLIEQAVAAKPKRHRLSEGARSRRHMAQIGG